jgi:hypothetical protein
MSDPGENLSLDEGMAAADSTMNPIYTTVNLKPLEGLRFFILVSFLSKIAVGLLADLKQFPRATYQNHT